MQSVLVRASAKMLLVRFGDTWFRYDNWRDLLRDLNSTDRLYVQAVNISTGRDLIDAVKP